VAGKQVCMSCAAQLGPSSVEPAPLGSHLPAFVGGLVGALLGAAIFAGIGIATDHAIGYVAVLVGFLTGRGVKLGARGAFAPSLQLLAGGLAVFGIVASKYIMLAYVFSEEAAISPLSGRVFDAFVSHFGELLSPFDLLWVGLAFAAAARASKPSVDR
jgi:hypothetical protein